VGTYQASPKVLFLTTSDAIGGMERVVVSLAGSFSARHWRVQCVFPETAECTGILTWCHELGVEAETSAAVRPVVAPHSVHDALRLWRFVRASRANIVNLHYGGGHVSLKDILAVRLAGRRRCVVTVHHPTSWGEAGEQKRRLTRVAAHLADAMVTVSAATRGVLLDAGVPAAKIHLIPCGLPAPKYSPTRAEARCRLGLPATAFVISSLARLIPDKGVHDLIEAASNVPDPRGELKLVVGGDGPERFALEALAADRLGDRAVFLGRVRDTADLYAAADVFALPSHLEGFGLVYVEAAFHGVPSIGANVGGVPDTIKDGETGLLVPPGDHALLAIAIQRMRDDSAMRLRLGEAARARACAEFTDFTMAESYARVFRA
jgi:glycosyltransferase involved in cell wall biosynthesis